MAAFADMIGLPAHLQEEMQAGRAVQAYLFSGPAGTGKRTLAALCAQALNCKGAPGTKPCGICPSCVQYESGNHPDHIRVTAGADKASIGVDAVRDLISRVGIHPYEDGIHTVIIEGADKMTPQAQNALLKTLESPPEDAVFFLTADQTAPILPTIQSRCRGIRFSPLSLEQVETALERRGIPREKRALLASLSEGSVGRALAIHENEQFWKTRELVDASLRGLHTPADVALCALPLCEKKEQAADVLDLMELWARDAMVQREGGTAIQQDLAPAFSQAGFSPSRLLRGVFDARARVASNVSWQQVLEMLFFDLVSGG